MVNLVIVASNDCLFNDSLLIVVILFDLFYTFISSILIFILFILFFYLPFPICLDMSLNVLKLSTQQIPLSSLIVD